MDDITITAEVELELLRVFNVDVRDVFRPDGGTSGLTPGRLRNLIANLPSAGEPRG